MHAQHRFDLRNAKGLHSPQRVVGREIAFGDEVWGNFFCLYWTT